MNATANNTWFDATTITKINNIYVTVSWQNKIDEQTS